MKWISLFNKIGKQNIGIINKTDVYVLDFNGKRRNLELKFDVHNVPYFVFKEQTEFKE